MGRIDEMIATADDEGWEVVQPASVDHAESRGPLSAWLQSFDADAPPDTVPVARADLRRVLDEAGIEWHRMAADEARRVEYLTAITDEVAAADYVAAWERLDAAASRCPGTASRDEP